MYPVTVQHSLLVAFLLSLKGSSIHSAGDICAPVGSTAHLSCPDPCSKKYIWTLNKKRLNLFKSDQKKYSLDTKTCSLTVQNLNKTDGGTYRYCKTDDDDEDDDDCRKRCRTTLCVTDVQVSVDVDRVTEGQKVTLTCHTSCPPNTQSFIWMKNTQRLDLPHFRNELCFDGVSSEDTGRYSCAIKHYKSFSSAERFLKVSYVMIDSTGIIILSSLLVLLTLMMIGAAVWRRRKNLTRREGNESNTQSTIHGLPYTVYENVRAVPSTTFNMKRIEKSGHEDEVQHGYVNFRTFPKA